MNWLQRRRLGLYEVRNWFYIRKVIKRNRDTEQWKNLNLRNGWVGQIYTVISLRKEDMGEEGTLQKMRVIERIEPTNKYLESLDLSEIIYPEMVKLEDSRSWLIIYWPLWQHFSIWRLFVQIISLFCIYLGMSKLGAIDYLISLI
jgi:hypothetical protein